jgi:hypothetical protein
MRSARVRRFCNVLGRIRNECSAKWKDDDDDDDDDLFFVFLFVCCCFPLAPPERTTAVTTPSDMRRTMATNPTVGASFSTDVLTMFQHKCPYEILLLLLLIYY